MMKSRKINISTLHTPNICRRSGSRKRKGMLDTWRRLGVPLASESSPGPPPPPPPPEPTPDSIWEDPSDCRSKKTRKGWLSDYIDDHYVLMSWLYSWSIRSSGCRDNYMKLLHLKHFFCCYSSRKKPPAKKNGRIKAASVQKNQERKEINNNRSLENSWSKTNSKYSHYVWIQSIIRIRNQFIDQVFLNARNLMWCRWVAEHST